MVWNKGMFLFKGVLEGSVSWRIDRFNMTWMQQRLQQTRPSFSQTLWRCPCKFGPIVIVSDPFPIHNLNLPTKLCLMLYMVTVALKTTENLEQLEVVYQQWGSGIPKKHLIQLILIILSCCWVFINGFGNWACFLCALLDPGRAALYFWTSKGCWW